MPAMAVVLLLPGRVPEMIGDKFEDQAGRRRPGEGFPRRGLRPGFEIAEVGRQRAQCICAHAFLGEMLQCRDVIMGEQEGQLIAPIKRQNGPKRVEFKRAAVGLIIERERRFRMCGSRVGIG